MLVNLNIKIMRLLFGEFNCSVSQFYTVRVIAVTIIHICFHLQVKGPWKFKSVKPDAYLTLTQTKNQIHLFSFCLGNV